MVKKGWCGGDNSTGVYRRWTWAVGSPHFLFSAFFPSVLDVVTWPIRVSSARRMPLNGDGISTRKIGAAHVDEQFMLSRHLETLDLIGVPFRHGPVAVVGSTVQTVGWLICPPRSFF